MHSLSQEDGVNLPKAPAVRITRQAFAVKKSKPHSRAIYSALIWDMLDLETGGIKSPGDERQGNYVCNLRGTLRVVVCLSISGLNCNNPVGLKP